MSESMGNIVSLGARCPLGLNSLQVAMCVRAKKHEPRSCQFVDKRDQPIGVCLTGGLPGHLVGFERMLQLAAPALTEATAGLEHDVPPPLFLALPEPGRPDDSAGFGERFVEALAAQSGFAIDHTSSQVVRCGHAGVAYALEAGAALLHQGAETVIVGGVDSYYHPGVLAWLDDAYRLHALNVQDGFTPSEGAAFFVLRRSAKESLGQVRRVATAKENGPEAETPNIGAAMTQLLSRFTSGGEPFKWVMTDNNGERHRAREWAMVSVRGGIANDAEHHRPVSELGDVGAATGALFLAIACRHWDAGCAPAQRVLLALHSEGGERGAIEIGVPS